MKYSIVNYQDIDELSFRFDAEFYHPEYLSNQVIIKEYENGHIKFGKIIKYMSGGATPLGANYPETGIPFLRVQNIMNNYFNDDDIVYITETDHDLLKRSKLKENDVLLTITGISYGKSAVVIKKYEGANINQHSVKIELDTSRFLPYFISTFLNSSYGKKQSDKFIVGITRPALDYKRIREYLIPLLSLDFQRLIEKIGIKSHNTIDYANYLYSQAEQILLSELDLSNWKPKHRFPFVKNYSDTQSSSRIDAEYFQPMYEEVEKILSKYEQKTLDSLCSSINYGTVPTSPYCEIGIPYIKGLNIAKGFICGQLDKIKNTDHLPKKFYTKENDIVISQMGTVDKAGIVTKSEEDYLFASFTIRIRLRDYDYIDPYVLTLYINKVAREWYILRKIAQASVRQNTDLPTIKALRVPKINKGTQQQIRDAILTSQRSKTTSKQLLGIAKRGVELAIEKDEKQAQKWMDSELEKISIK